MLGELFSGLAKIASKVADFFSDSEEKRPAIENKTDSGKKTIQFSSIAAWDDSNNGSTCFECCDVDSCATCDGIPMD